ncbi:MAG: hypothetical protein KAS11_02155 [Candidatus Aenigmarchaeota archaeon]|nr:hypothetical protein [Candidatus Aenigmarchaeota archaeon]
MDLFSKLKETVTGKMHAASGANLDGASSNIDDILKSDPTADMSKSSKVLEASVTADYSGGLNLDSKTPLNPPNQIIRDAPQPDISGLPPQNLLDAGTVPPGQPNQINQQAALALDSSMSPGANPTDQAYPQDQSAMAQAAYPASQPVSAPGGLDMNAGQIPAQTQAPSPIPSVGQAIPEYPQAPKPVSDMQQQSDMPVSQRIDMALELRDLKNQVSLVIEKLNVIEERTRRFSY